MLTDFKIINYDIQQKLSHWLKLIAQVHNTYLWLIKSNIQKSVQYRSSFITVIEIGVRFGTMYFYFDRIAPIINRFTVTWSNSDMPNGVTSIQIPLYFAQRNRLVSFVNPYHRDSFFSQKFPFRACHYFNVE